MSQRDTLYETEILKQVQKAVLFLNRYAEENSSWDQKDLYAIERALQILIESLIGFSRYVVETKYELHISKSREAIDELKNLQHFDEKEYTELIKIIGFRNILVHEYLNINLEIVKAIVLQRKYAIVLESIKKLRNLL